MLGESADPKKKKGESGSLFRAPEQPFSGDCYLYQ
jgi:hypothetical protein